MDETLGQTEELLRLLRFRSVNFQVDRAAEHFQSLELDGPTDGDLRVRERPLVLAR